MSPHPIKRDPYEILSGVSIHPDAGGDLLGTKPILVS